MTSETTLDLERKAERVRDDIADTTDHLRAKMSPGQLVDEVMGHLKDGSGSEFVSNLKHQVRDNPLALALIGSGLAWLTMGDGAKTSGRRVRREVAPRNGAALDPVSTHGGLATSSHASPASSHLGDDKDHAASSKTRDALAKGGAGLKSAATTTRDAASGAIHEASDRLHQAGDAVRHGAHDLRDRGSEWVDTVESKFLDVLEREPLVIGALGVAVGAAIGAMLPSTRLEEEKLGPARAAASEKVDEVASSAVSAARDVASDAYEAAKDEADRHGLGKGRPVAEKLGEVAKAAAHQTTMTSEEKLDADRSSEEKLEADRSSSPARSDFQSVPNKKP